MPSATHHPTGELGRFLRARRAELTPEAAGITSFGVRRVPGLRREELAQLAGVSTAYLTRLEQGQSANASASVLDALATALQLADDEREHLRALARQGGPPPPKRRRSQPRPGALALLGAMPHAAALLLGPRTEILGWNRLGHLLLAGHVDSAAPQRPAGRPNLTRLLFLDPHTRELHRDWPAEARLSVASLRFVAATMPDDPEMSELIGELTRHSDDFASLWRRHPVTRCSHGIKQLHHPSVGELDVPFEVLHLPGDPGQRLLVLAPTPDSPAAHAATLLLTTG